jgi:hypothetical protein
LERESSAGEGGEQAVVDCEVATKGSGRE